MTAEQIERLRKAIAYCLSAELAREHLKAVFQPVGTPCRAGDILLEEFMAFLAGRTDAALREAYTAGRINEYRAVQGMVRRMAARLKNENLVHPFRLQRVAPWTYTARRTPAK